MLLDQARLYLQKGFSIVPCRLYFAEDGKCKKPATVKWIPYQKEKVSQTVLLTQWKSKLQDEPGVGIALITGQLSNLLVVDIDTDTTLERIKPFVKGIKTPTIRTPSGGWHIYFQYRDGLNTTAGLDDDGLDVRAEGGYVVAPPSQYPNGQPYSFVDGYDINIPIVPIPDDLFNYLASLIKTRGGVREGAGRQSKSDWFTELLENGVDEGSRTTKLVEAIGYMLGRKIPKEIIRATIKLLNRTLDTPLTEKELKTEVLPAIARISKDIEANVLEELNEHLSLVTLDSGDRVIAEKYNSYQGQMNLRFAKIHQVRESFINKTVLINKKPESKFDIWRGHPDKKEFKGVIFNPSEPPWESGDFINLWRGIRLKPKKGDWSLFRDHIEHIIGGQYYEWILQWMSRIVQDPGGERPGTVLVLRGGQGTGKGTFANIFGRIFGEREYFFRVSKIHDLTGKFNEDLKTAILLHIDEATWGGDKESAGVLKSLITEPTRRIEPKGINAFHIENYLNLIISSNNDWVVPIGAQERRFLVLDIPDTRQGDIKYFQEIHKQMYKAGGLEAMYYDLLEYKWDIETLKRVPRTSGGMQQAVKGMDLFGQFWLDRLHTGRLVDSHSYWKNIVINEKLYNQYKSFCKERMAHRGMDNQIAFGIKLKNLCPKVEITKKRIGGGRVSCKILPDLKDCREVFCKVLGFDIEWPEICEPPGITKEMRNQDEPFGDDIPF